MDLAKTVEECVDRAVSRVGKNLVLVAPLGLGKPVQLLNAFYHRAVADPEISLHPTLNQKRCPMPNISCGKRLPTVWK